jgi:FkbM family methyltransferase
MHLGHRMLIDLRSETEAVAYYTGDYETQSIKSILKLIQPEWTVLDVGANVGFWTVPLACALHDGQLHAYEPVPGNFIRLAENVRVNDVEAMVRLHSKGLSDRTATMQISLREDFQHGAETGNAAIVIDRSDEKFSCIEIEVTSLDEEVSGNPNIHRIDFIKLDIEGHEDRFLAGAVESIRRFRPVLLMEINEEYYRRRGIDPTDVFEQWMQAFCYCCVLSTRTGWQFTELSRRKPGLDDVFLCPSEKASDLVKLLRT